jgi:hypothetical protein
LKNRLNFEQVVGEPKVKLSFISSDTIKIPEEYRGAVPVHALVMVIGFEKHLLKIINPFVVV